MIDAGFFARRVAPRPAGMPAAGVREICSVSERLSSGPESWIAHWRHSGLGWFNRIADALAVVPPDQASVYRLFAYRIHPEISGPAGRVAIVLPDAVRPEPITREFRSLGFDSAARSRDSVGFGCSPLSCNRLAAEMETSEPCLFRDLGTAIAGAERFAADQPEPGSTGSSRCWSATAAQPRPGGDRVVAPQERRE